MLRLQILHIVGYVRPIDHSASDDSLVNRCIRMIPSARAPESDRERMLSLEDNMRTTNGKILEILRVRNRFVIENNTAHSSGGFRDLSFKVKVGFQVPAGDVLSSRVFRTVSTLQCCACRSPRADHLSL